MKAAILRLQRVTEQFDARVSVLENGDKESGRPLESRLALMDERVEALEGAAQDQAARIDALENAMQAAMDRIERREPAQTLGEHRLAALEERIDALESVRPGSFPPKEASREAQAVANAPNPVGLTSAAGADDLTRIKGVGPKYNRLLLNAGVRTFSQIADWTDDDLARIASKLSIKASRIKKADWVSSARALANPEDL